jgi:hypothetical protein
MRYGIQRRRRGVGDAISDSLFPPAGPGALDVLPLFGSAANSSPATTLLNSESVGGAVPSTNLWLIGAAVGVFVLAVAMGGGRR